MVKVKICGITNIGDAETAINAGADALGFVFAPSPRQASPETVLKIVAALPPFVAAVGVFVNEGAERLRELFRKCGLDYIQFHGDEPPELVNQLSKIAIKAIRVKGESSLDDIDRYRARAFLLDSHVSGVRGGSGVAFSWELAAKAKNRGRAIILSGGLNVDNVSDAVRLARPYAVDVSSGVESAPGRKDEQMVREFVRRAKEAI